MSIPISVGSGAASVAAEAVAGLQYQQVEILGKGGSSVMSVNPDGSHNVSIIGAPLVGASLVGIGPVKIGYTVDLSGQDNTASTYGLYEPNGSLSTSPISTRGYVFNGNNWDRQRGNSSVGTLVYTGTGSVVTVPSGNQSVSGAINISGSVLLGSSNASIFAVPTLNQSVSGALNISGSVLLGSSNASVIAVASGNQSVSGALFISGSVLLGSSNASVITYIQNSSIIAVPTGSVIALNIGSIISLNIGSIITVFKDSSILSVPVGSVITVWKDSSVLSVPVGSTIAVLQSPSIVGTYSEDAAHATGDKGIFGLNVRNDTLASVTSADGDYGALSVGPAGEGIFANAPLTKWVQGTADLRGAATLGASAIAIAAGGSSIFTYITGVQVANMGSASVLVTFASGGSTLGYTIAPAGGGSNIYYPNALKTPANFGFAASLSGVASVLVSAQGFISKT